LSAISAIRNFNICRVQVPAELLFFCGKWAVLGQPVLFRLQRFTFHLAFSEGIDKNFAIHFPWIDKIFGTYYFPDQWPEHYGLSGEQIAPGFLEQTIEPFIGKKKNDLKT